MKKRILTLLLIFISFFSLIIVKADSIFNTEYTYISSSILNLESNTIFNSLFLGSIKIYLKTLNIIYSVAVFVGILCIAIPFLLFFIKPDLLSISFFSKKYKFEPPVPLDDSFILNVIPNFNKNEFSKIFYQNFVNVQKAYSEFDYANLKLLTSDELYNTYISNLEYLVRNDEKNVMDDFVLEDCYITDLYKNNTSINVKVFMLISFYDYLISSNQNIVLGSNTKKVKKAYCLTYIKDFDNKSDNNNNWILGKSELLAINDVKPAKIYKPSK